jgi:hypothetical protein
VLRRRVGGWPLLVLALGLGVLVERLVVTDTEAVEALLDEAIAAVKARELGRLRPLLADDFDFHGRGPEAALAEAQRLLDRHRPTLLELTPGPVVVAGSRAEVLLKVRALAYGGAYAGWLALGLVRERTGWRLLSAAEAGQDPAAFKEPGQNGR